ncbi:autoinducer 2 ABC transporter substrate-binding protein [Pectobacterium parmentieri]|uniref:Autoinducer 2 ABC transporter substrate-binding protein n=1 Tax=Pectobacterium parmentieri TaxID=1905730 RepID=A0A0H3I8X0_PECPM|nr:substrate-binding domain-containing protein [Pectobacterium parmentieri]ACX89459.1 carbohydrate ABC transporter periplasmic-binding protein [Pectobacterium parmentieri WPP163]AFI91928.1 Autoinducer 2-binding protein lsrB [Pectobacterium parmentieri]AOR57305.1 LacI family transcriptional regulator [Pectobacterium parmentieri]AYH02863.1 autoinducer 2 ABC transporter substrate-binding protein [Pectobacterium parmentieri]AYH07128.1 autoinducer 2 ABC transporter substrate-binding protein [Pectob
MKRTFLACTLLALLSSAHADAAEKLRMGVVVKIGGIPWFNAMEAGIKSEAAKLGIDAWQVGPTAADPALQVRAIEDLIAQKVDIIGVVPNDPKVLEPVLKRAQEAGIKVLVHESPGQKYADWDFELVDAPTHGINHMKALAACMKEEGKYAMYVGSLTVPLHQEWTDAALEYQKTHYPKMQLVTDKFGVGESLDGSIRTSNELMSKYPDLKGIMAFGSQGPIGAGRAVMNRNKTDQICVIGAFSPGQGATLVNRGAIKGGYIWNPKTAGEVFVRLADMMQKNQPITDGMTIEGLGKVNVDAQARTILGNNTESLDKANLPKLIEMGL